MSLPDLRYSPAAIEFTLPIEPRSVQFGARVGRNKSTGRAFIFSDNRKTSYLSTVAALAHPHRPPAPLVGPLCVDFVFVVPRPKCLLAKKYPDGLIPCPVRPDRDNLQKGTQDGLSRAGFWTDDAQICDGRTSKFYAERTGKPRIEVTIRPFYL